MIGMLLDQQVPMEWAFTGAYTIKQRIGHCDAKKIAAMDADAFVTMCCTKPAIHRFPASMAKRIYDMSTIIAAEYKGKAENIWKDVEDAEEFAHDCENFPVTAKRKLKFLLRCSASVLVSDQRAGKSKLASSATISPALLPTFIRLQPC
jgi:uncharacterized HhH-GPD family protein